MAAEYPALLPNFTGTTETAPATTTPSGFSAWATKVKDEIVALAQDKALGVKYASGLWCAEPGSTNTHTPAVNTLIVSRYDFAPGQTLVGLAEFLITAIASGVRRLGVYADDGTGYPGALLVEAGTYDASTGATAWKQAGGADFTAVAVGGTVWIGGVSQGAAPGVGGWLVHGRSVGVSALASIPANNSPWEGFSHASVTGALPANFTTTRTLQNGAPRVIFKTG